MTSTGLRLNVIYLEIELTRSSTSENSGELLVLRGRAGSLALISSVNGGRCLMK